MRRLLSFFAMVFSVLAVVFFAIPAIQNPTLGIEFQGGYEIVYEVSEKDGAEMPAVQDIADVIADRIDIAGVKNPQVNTETVPNSSSQFIRVCVTSSNTAELSEILTLIESDSEITFTDSNGEFLMDGSVLAETDGAVLSYDNGQPIVLLNIRDTRTFGEVTGQIAGSNMMAWIGYVGPSDTYIGDFEAYTNGTPEQQAAAARKLIVNATVNEALTGDTAQISGSFTAQEASQIGKLLSAGNMDFVLTRTDVMRVDGAYGAQAFQSSVIAGLIGLIAIMIMMIIIYKIPGVVSVITLALYTAAILLVFNLIGGEYGPDTIAAIVIGLGMAVDACIILFERLTDELYKGRSVKAAYEESTKKSLSSIVDANLTTIIAACALYFFGRRSVKGFATMLLITTVFNVVIMLLVTRLLMFLLIKSGKLDNHKYLLGVKESRIPDINKGESQTYFGKFQKINFIKQTKKVIIGFCALFVIGIGFAGGHMIAGNHALNFGLDFLQGSTATININDLEVFMNEEEVDFSKIGTARLRDDGTPALNAKGSQIYDFSEDTMVAFLRDTLGYPIDPISVSITGGYNTVGYVASSGTYTLSIKLEYDETFTELSNFAEDIERELYLSSVGSDYGDYVTISEQTSTPTMATATVINALLSLAVAFILIVLYISIRFRYTYALASIAALIFDCATILAMFAIFRVRVETEFVSAILAIIGYSINDTVVIFDRIREISKETNYGKVSEEERYKIANIALQNTATRSLWTTLSTVLPVLALIFIGTSSTLAFSIAMLIGLLSGIFSSMFIAPTLWLKLEKRHMIKLHDKAVKAAENVGKKKSSGPDEMTIIGIND